MDTLYKSAATMSSQPWVDHFKHTVGKSAPFTTKTKMVLLKRNPLKGEVVNTKSLPLTVVSPTEQFAEMAQAAIDKNTPKYKVSSVERHQSRRKHRNGSSSRHNRGDHHSDRRVKRKKNTKTSEGKVFKRSGRKSGKGRKKPSKKSTGGDILS